MYVLLDLDNLACYLKEMQVLVGEVLSDKLLLKETLKATNFYSQKFSYS